MRAGAAVAEKLGHAAAIATVRGCLDAAPLGPTTLQFHDDVRQPTGRWAQMSTVSTMTPGVVLAAFDAG